MKKTKRVTYTKAPVRQTDMCSMCVCVDASEYKATKKKRSTGREDLKIGKAQKLTENCSDVRKVITIYLNIIYGRMMYQD